MGLAPLSASPRAASAALAPQLGRELRPGGEAARLAEAVRSARRGDQMAWDALVSRFSGLVWATVRSFGLDSHDAGEAARTTWLTLAQHLGAIRDPQVLGAWLQTAARREARAAVHRAGRREPRAAELERGEALRQALAELPPPHRRLMMLLALDPRPTYAEIAALLQMPIGSIGPTRRRCLDRLQERMQVTGAPLPPGARQRRPAP